MKRHIIVALAGVLLLIPLVFGFITTAVAASPTTPSKPHQPGTFIHLATSVQPLAVDPPNCSGNGCNNQNPYVTFCAGQSWDSWWVVTSSNIYYKGAYTGYLQLWYSQTCGTNWGRVVPQVPYSAPAVNTILSNGTATFYVTGTIGNQLYAPTLPAATETCFLFSGHQIVGSTGQFPFPNPACGTINAR